MVTRVPAYPCLPGPGQPVLVLVPPQPPPTRSGTRFQISRPGCNSTLCTRTYEYSSSYFIIQISQLHFIINNSNSSSPCKLIEQSARAQQYGSFEKAGRHGRPVHSPPLLAVHCSGHAQGGNSTPVKTHAESLVRRAKLLLCTSILGSLYGFAGQEQS